MKTVVKLVGGIVLEIAVATIVCTGTLALTDAIHGKIVNHKIKKATKKVTRDISIKNTEDK